MNTLAGESPAASSIFYFKAGSEWGVNGAPGLLRLFLVTLVFRGKVVRILWPPHRESNRLNDIVGLILRNPGLDRFTDHRFRYS